QGEARVAKGLLNNLSCRRRGGADNDFDADTARILPHAEAGRQWDAIEALEDFDDVSWERPTGVVSNGQAKFSESVGRSRKVTEIADWIVVQGANQVLRVVSEQ